MIIPKSQRERLNRAPAGAVNERHSRPKSNCGARVLLGGANNILPPLSGVATGSGCWGGIIRAVVNADRRQRAFQRRRLQFALTATL